jgi:hypothetical protein
LTFANGGTSTTYAAASEAVKTQAIANYIACFNLVASRLKANAVWNGEQLVDIIHELGADNFSAEPASLARFIPNLFNFDIIAFNRYNRSGISSGYTYFQDFKASLLSTYQQLERLCPGKEMMVGEMSSTAAGIVSSVSISNGGSLYPASTSFVLNVNASGSIPPILTATTNGSGVITSIAVTYKGEDNRFVSIPGTQNGGTGLTTTVNITNNALKYSKAAWFTDAFEFIRSECKHLNYVSLFLENKNEGPTDNRDWAPNSPDTKAALGVGLNLLRARAAVPTKRITNKFNYCPDPFTERSALWSTSGSNAATLNFSTNIDNFPFDYTGKRIGGVLFDAAANPSANDSLILIDLPRFTNPRGNESYTISMRAAFNPYIRPANPRYSFDATLLSPNGTMIGRLPVREVKNKWDFYQWTVATGIQSNTSGWKLAIRIGQINASGQFLFSDVKVEYGEEATPIYHPNIELRQLPITSSTGNTVTLNERKGQITTSTLTTAAGAATTITLNNNLIVAAENRIVWSYDRYSGTIGTNGSPFLQPATVIDGQATLLINNLHASNALNGTMQLYYELLEN